MAPQKQAKNSLWRSARYYREHPEARVKKKATDTLINARPEQRAKRSELSTKRKAMARKWIKLKWKDLAHTKSWIRLKSIKANRWAKWDTKWDKNARWCK